MTQPAKMIFLRSLLSEEDDEIRNSPYICPEPSILWSLTQKDRSDSAMAKELRGHVSHCSPCADLTTRLLAFQNATVDEGTEDLEKEWAKAEPRLNAWIRRYLKSQPKQRAERGWSWRLPNLSWGLQFAALSCLLAVAVAAGVWIHLEVSSHPARSSQVASIPNHRGAQPLPPSTTSHGDSDLLMKGDELDATKNGADQRRSTTLFFGGPMRLLVTATESQDDGSLKLNGKLMPDPTGGDKSYIADVTGTFLVSRLADGLTLSIQDVTLNDKSYIASGPDGRAVTTATLIHAGDVPQPGQTLEIEVPDERMALTPSP
jgi:hypothetical protein